LLNDFGERRRIATIAAQLLDLQVMLTDAAIAMFVRLTGQLFTRSKNKQDQVWAMGKSAGSVCYNNAMKPRGDGP
jgi:hypothetical protein